MESARKSPLHLLTSAALDIILPRSCVLCGQLHHGDDRHACSGCRKRLHLETAQSACPRCGHSIGPYGLHEGRCFVCRNRRPHVTALVRIGPYEDMTAGLVRAFKYGGRDELDAFLGDWLAEVIGLAPWADGIDALVCVPTHWRHALGRSYYAPRILARAVSRAAGIPLAPVLRRIAAGPHQLNVPRSERAANIRGKFAMARGAGVEGTALCLIDDVSTTGATANECARILKAAGAATVYAAVIAKVDTEHRAIHHV